MYLTSAIESIGPRWNQQLGALFQQQNFIELDAYLEQSLHRGATLLPAREYTFRAFTLTPWDQVKVVIVGQDPYHGPGQANGLAFSVNPGIALPPSLRNIYKEVQTSTGMAPPKDGDLHGWACQGVLLLNRILTVEAGKAHSHRNRGWEEFTTQVLDALSSNKEGIIFVLWGKPAQQLMGAIDGRKHHVLTAPHPSPLSAYRGFLGCGHFSRINQILQQQGQETIQWGVEST